MARTLLVTLISCGLAFSFAPDKPKTNDKRPAPGSTRGADNSNAPAGTPAGTLDRDHGRARADEVGKGKQKGLNKSKRTQKPKTTR